MSLIRVNLFLNIGAILCIWKIWISKPVKQPERPSDRKSTSLQQVNLQNITFYLKLLEHSYVFIPLLCKYYLALFEAKDCTRTNKMVSVLKKMLIVKLGRQA